MGQPRKTKPLPNIAETAAQIADAPQNWIRARPRRHKASGRLDFPVAADQLKQQRIGFLAQVGRGRLDQQIEGLAQTLPGLRVDAVLAPILRRVLQIAVVGIYLEVLVRVGIFGADSAKGRTTRHRGRHPDDRQRTAQGAPTRAVFEEAVAALFAIICACLAPFFQEQDDRLRAASARVLWSGVHGISLLSMSGRLNQPKGMSAADMAELLVATILRGLQTWRRRLRTNKIEAAVSWLVSVF